MKRPTWLPDLDTRDAHIYGGMGLAGFGGWQVSPIGTCIAVGLILALLGIFAPRLGKGT